MSLKTHHLYVRVPIDVHSPNTLYFQAFYLTPSRHNAAVSHCGFNFNFPED